MRQTSDSSLDEMHVALLRLLRPHIGAGTSPSNVRQTLTGIRRRGRPCLRSCVIRVFGVVLSVCERGPTASVKSSETAQQPRQPADRPTSFTRLRVRNAEADKRHITYVCVRNPRSGWRPRCRTHSRTDTIVSFRIKRNDTSFMIFLDASSRSLRFG